MPVSIASLEVCCCTYRKCVPNPVVAPPIVVLLDRDCTKKAFNNVGGNLRLDLSQKHQADESASTRLRGLRLKSPNCSEELDVNGIRDVINNSTLLRRFSIGVLWHKNERCVVFCRLPWAWLSLIESHVKSKFVSGHWLALRMDGGEREASYSTTFEERAINKHRHIEETMKTSRDLT